MKDRRPNDLDDYLAEVEDGLFCISVEDRECLLRDLKAHVSELTTDPDYADRFSGRYGITRDQLLEEVGKPRELALDYVASTRIVPSRSLIAVHCLLLGFFVALAVVGIGWIKTPGTMSESNVILYRMLGVLFLIGGVLLATLTMIVGRNLIRHHSKLPFLIVIFAFVSISISTTLAGLVSRFFDYDLTSDLSERLTWLIFLDLFIVAMLGLYVSMEHIRVIEATRAARNM